MKEWFGAKVKYAFAPSASAKIKYTPGMELHCPKPVARHFVTKLFL